MKYTVNKTISICIILLLVGGLLSFTVGKQEVIADLDKINHLFESDKINLEMSYNLYKGYNMSNLRSSQKGSLQKDGDKFFYSMAGMEVYLNKDIRIVVERQQRMIIFSDPVDVQNDILKLPDMKTQLNQCSAIERLEINEASQGLRFDLKDLSSGYERVDMIYNKKDFSLEDIKLYYSNAAFLGEEWANNQALLHIAYKQATHNFSLPASSFNTSTYARELNGSFVPAEAFANYEIIDLRTH